MNTMTSEKEMREKSTTLAVPCRIVPAGIALAKGQKLTAALLQHTQEMLQVIKKLLSHSSLEYKNEPDFWATLRKALPIVHWKQDESTPGGINLYLLCPAQASYDLGHFFTEITKRLIVPGKQTTILSTKQLTFRFLDAPDENYFVAEAFALVEDHRALAAIQKNSTVFVREIALGALSPHHARQILFTNALTQEHKTTLIYQTIAELCRRGFRSIDSDVFAEMHHFLLASDDEFKRIRDVRHMSRIICAHNWFRKQIRKSKQPDRQVLVKPLSTNLQFQFGKKKVLGLTISISFLKEYEQFEARHITSACQRLVPTLTIVPRSFFHYKTPSDATHCFYLELEKHDTKPITAAEIALIRKELIHEIPHSIEQLSHTLFIPYNEEEIMRNILLLSQEIRYARDIPQMIISFQGQSDTTLRFHVTLLRLIKDAHIQTVDQLFAKVSELVEFIPGARKVIGSVRNKHPKEANTFILECPKTHFMRLDHSVDLSRAREFISAAIRLAAGEVRDFNGGLMSQQNQLLVGIKALLTPTERKEEMHLENLFHAIQPVLMRSLLPPELIKQLFLHFLTLHNERPTNSHARFCESFEHNGFCVMTVADGPTLADELNKQVAQLDFKEQEVACSRVTIDGLCYFGYVIVSGDHEKLMRFQSEMHKVFDKFTESTKAMQALRISLPRPTSSLDPRIGTDRTSGIVIKMLYEGLMRIDPTGTPMPAAAADIKISPDKKKYTFTLRKAYWTNGSQVLAQDFEYAWKKVLDPHFRAPFAYLFNPIKNARQVKSGQKPIEELGVRVIDDYTLEVELEHPAPFFLEHCAHWVYSPLCKQVDQLHPGWAYYGDDTYVSNGPFRLAKWKQNSEIQVLKNPLYWDAAAVKLHQIDISIVEDPNDALQLYQKGELDWIGEPLSEIPPEAFKRVNFQDKIISHPIAAVHWYSCNLEIAPFTSKKCRKALAIALNRKEIVEELFQGLEKPATSILPPGLSQHPNPYFYDGDVAYARRLFTEGLAELGIAKEDLPPFMITCCDQEIHRSMAEAVSMQWKEVLGIETKIETFKWDRFMEKCWQRDFQLMGLTWYSWVYDPSYNLEHLYSLSHEMNFAQWHDAMYSAYLDKAQNCSDKQKRLEYLHEAENIIMDEIPIIPLIYYTFKYMKKDHLDSIYLSHLGQIDFKWAEINRPQ